MYDRNAVCFVPVNFCIIAFVYVSTFTAYLARAAALTVVFSRAPVVSCMHFLCWPQSATSQYIHSAIVEEIRLLRLLTPI